jgi:hypothetical protein
MKKVVSVITCMVMFTASAAMASTISIYNTAGDVMGTLNVARSTLSVGGASYDKLVFSLASWSLSSGYSSTTAIGSLSGTWATTSSSNGICLSSPTDYGWGDDTHGWTSKNKYYTPNAPQSYVNFDKYVPTTASYDPWTRNVALGDMYSSFHGAWYATSGSSYTCAIGDVLAELYVTVGADVKFMTANDGIDGIGTTSSTNSTFSGSFTTVPEPSMIALLAGAICGLIAYAWRKRK